MTPMRQSWSILALLVMIGALVLGAFAIRTLPASKDQTAPADDAGQVAALEAPSIDYANPSKGPLDATVRIVEYGDFLCEACAQMSVDLDRLLAAYPSVRLVWKDFPDTAAHPGTDTAAIAARCAQRQGAFWPFHDLLLKERIAVDDASLVAAAGMLRLDTDAFGTCLRNKDTIAMVERDFVEGQRLRVDGTPYFFINDRRVSGLLGYDQLVQIVEALGAVAVPAAAQL